MLAFKLSMCVPVHASARSVYQSHDPASTPRIILLKSRVMAILAMFLNMKYKREKCVIGLVSLLHLGSNDESVSPNI